MSRSIGSQARLRPRLCRTTFTTDRPARDLGVWTSEPPWLFTSPALKLVGFRRDHGQIGNTEFRVGPYSHKADISWRPKSQIYWPTTCAHLLRNIIFRTCKRR